MRFPAVSPRCASRIIRPLPPATCCSVSIPTPYQLALAKAEAEIDSARAAVEQLKASLHEIRAEAREAENKLSYLQTQARRQRELSGRGVTSAAKLEQSNSEEQEGEDRLAVLHQRIARVEAALGGKPDRPTDSLRRCARRWRCAIAPPSISPIPRSRRRSAGTVVNFRLQLGEQVKAQTPLFALGHATARPVARSQLQGDRPHPRDGGAESQGRARHASRHHLGRRGGKHQSGDRRGVRDPAGAKRLGQLGEGRAAPAGAAAADRTARANRLCAPA